MHLVCLLSLKAFTSNTLSYGSIIPKTSRESRPDGVDEGYGTVVHVLVGIELAYYHSQPRPLHESVAGMQHVGVYWFHITGGVGRRITYRWLWSWYLSELALTLFEPIMQVLVPLLMPGYSVVRPNCIVKDEGSGRRALNSRETYCASDKCSINHLLLSYIHLQLILSIFTSGLNLIIIYTS